ncbi:MAG TPA: ATP-binding protein [Sphingobacteriaceae bacterium]
MPTDSSENPEEVFSYSAYKEKSYVYRRPYEEPVADWLLQSSPGILEISGPSKAGKTLLVRHSLLTVRRYKQIWLYGQFIKSIEGFWSYLSNELGVVAGSKNTIFGGEINAGPAKGTISVGTTEEFKPNITEILRQLMRQQPILIIDDFHWIKQSVRSEIIFALKPLTEHTDMNTGRGLKVLILFVQTKEISTSEIWREVQGRPISANVPLWTTDDLLRIVTRPFERGQAAVLNAYSMAFECYGLPSMMQRICFEYWHDHVGKVVFGNTYKIQPKQLKKVLEKIANQLWFSGGDRGNYETLTNQSAIKELSNLESKDGKLGNINQMILLALTTENLPSLGSSAIEGQIQVPLHDIVKRLEMILTQESYALLSKDLVIKALRNMSRKAKRKYLNVLKKHPDTPIDPLLEYTDIKTTGSGALTIYSPSFLVTLRHSIEHQQRFRTQGQYI